MGARIIISPAGVVAAMTGSTAGAAGTGGSIPAPPAGSQGQFLRGDATFGGAIPNWVTGTDYTAGDAIVFAQTVFRALANHTAGAFDPAEWERERQYSVANVAAAATLAWYTEYRANTSGGAFSVVLPTTPEDGVFVRVADVVGSFKANPLTVDAGPGHTIEGATDRHAARRSAAQGKRVRHRADQRRPEHRHGRDGWRRPSRRLQRHHIRTHHAVCGDHYPK